MLKHNFIHELKTLTRNRWMLFLGIIILVFFSFATFNGHQKVEKRALDINAAKQEVKDADQEMLMLIDSVERGMEVSAPYWTIPTSPMAVGNYHPRVAAMDPEPWAFIATGQSDLFTHYVKPTVAGDDHTLNYTEMTSPIQLLFGSFDISFVIIYLLPLIIVAFSYNILSSERENGSLRLLASNSISLQKWVIQKLAFRFLFVALVSILVLGGIFLIKGFDLFSNFGEFLSLVLVMLGYVLFWFVLAFIINISSGSSAKNAIVLLGLWVGLVLLVPSILNQLGNSIYPMPSRTLMINDMRQIKVDVSQKQDEILDNYLRDHPEYAINDTTENRSFYHRYMASQMLVKKELEPAVSEFEDQLKRQQQWLNQFKWLSPAILVQESMNHIAGTSTSDYESYRKQVSEFADIWRNHFMPLLYNNQKFSEADYKDLPSFQYKSKKTSVKANLLLLFVISLILGLTFGISHVIKGKKASMAMN
ncbi:DUF3526 domain-containing protein [Flagellimonas nanhaiensis]|uniref:DUF3526 domain-containing protein n=1 Tax=Flagellimonas nanhaiensis TaxID=2292706 RepID=A0A371JV64_9FLAO|nr:DUF3526 domain-containing protein [Allomuricauda nanhaiensis]RDY61672.1 DUF3526 domain-containing protein [Allomuricauda nanhaiensis]